MKKQFDELKKQDQLDAEGCPTIDAYKIAVSTVSQDFCPLCQSLFDHAATCPKCQQRYEAAIRESREKRA